MMMPQYTTNKYIDMCDSLLLRQMLGGFVLEVRVHSSSHVTDLKVQIRKKDA